MYNLLTPPPNVVVTENPTSYYWFDDDGILYSVSKKVPPISHEENKKIIEEFKRLSGGKKFCMLLDVTHAAPSDKEDREFAAREFPSIVKAMALVSGSPLGRMVGNLFFAAKPPPYPARMFSSEKEAKDWLKKYL